MKIFLSKAGLMLVLLFTSVSFNNQAADYTWSSFLGSTNWNSAINWGGGIPGPGDNVTITGLVINSPRVPAGGVTINNFTMNNGALLGQGLNCNGETLTITGTASFNGATATAGNIICTGSSANFNGTEFDAAVTATCGTILLNGSVFNSTATLTKNGASNDAGDGGNEFNGALTLVNSGTGTLRTGINTVDDYNNTVVITNSGTGTIIVAENTGVTDFAGTVTMNNLSSGSIYMGNGAASDVLFQSTVAVNNSGIGTILLAEVAGSNIDFTENFTVSSTANGFIYFGENGGTSNLPDTKTITVGAGGFSAGMVSLKNFTQVGTTAQTLTLSGSGSLRILENSVFNADLTTSSGTGTLTIRNGTLNGKITGTYGRILLEGGTFADTAILNKTGTSTDNSVGGNSFTELVTFTNSSTGDFNLATTVADTYSDSVIAKNNDGGTLSLATGNATHTFNGLYLENNGTGQVYLSKNTGAITTVNSPFAAKLTSNGEIHISEATGSSTSFTENITFENTSTGSINTGNSGGTTSLASGKTVTIGSAGFVGGNLILNEFNQIGGLTQNLNLTSNGALTIGTNSIFNGRLNANTVNGRITFETATLMDTVIAIGIGIKTQSTTYNDYTYLSGSGGATYTSSGGNTFNALTEILNIGTGTTRLANTTIDIFNDSLYLNNTSTGTLILAHNASTVFSEVYALNTADGEIIIGNESSASTVHNGNLYLENTSTGSINLHKESGASATFIENILLTSSGTGSINFGLNGGSGTLAITKLISPTSAGVTSGLVSMFNFTQTGMTAQSIVTTASGSVTIGSGSIFNADISLDIAGTLTMDDATFNGTFTSTSDRLYSANSTYNDVTNMVKTGANNDYSNGGNTFNDSLNVTMNGSGVLRFASSAGDDYNEYTEFHWTAGTLEPCYTSINTFAKDILIDGALTMDLEGRVRLDGMNQTIEMTGVDSAYFDILDLSTATGTVTTIGHIILPNSASFIDLGNAVLDLNGYELRIHNDNVGALTRTNGYILTEQSDNSSKISWDINNDVSLFTFPLGNTNGTYIPFQIQVTSGNIGTVSVATYGTGSNNLPLPVTPDSVEHIFAYVGGSQVNNDAYTMDRFWQIDKTGTGTATIVFGYDDLEIAAPNTITEANLFAQRWNSAIKDWDDGIGSVNTVTNRVTATGVSNFSPWTLVDQSQPLPVEWLDFKVTKTSDNTAKLLWVTASEKNNDFFTIEKSQNTSSSEIVDYVNAQGNSDQTTSYEYTDPKTSTGINYYRIKQTDLDGRYTYTDWKSINISEFSTVQVSMNDGVIHINSSIPLNAALNVYSLEGKLITKTTITSDAGNSITIPTNSNSTGVYIYELQNESGEITSGKLFNN